MRVGTDEFGIDEIGTDGLVNLRLVKPSCNGNSAQLELE